MNIFKLKPTVVFGKDSLNYIERFKNGRVFIVADPFMVKSKKTDLLCSMLGECEIFDGIVPDPPLEVITEGITRIKNFCPDTVIAIGGGSAIDAAKAIVDFARKLDCVGDVSFIAVPTTSGTGSEVTSFAVITNRDKGIKYPLVSENLIPDAAILDPALVQTVPAAVAADTGLDVLTHAAEAYVSTAATDFSDAAAEKAAALVFEFLKKSCGGDEYSREKMHNASCLAGMAFNEASLGLCHAIAHNIGGRLKIAHGRANAVLLPHIIEFNAAESYAAERYARLARHIGISGSNTRMLVRSLINEIVRLRRDIGVPADLAGCGISSSALRNAAEAAAHGALADGCIKTNPRSALADDIKEILRKAEG